MFCSQRVCLELSAHLAFAQHAAMLAVGATTQRSPRRGCRVDVPHTTFDKQCCHRSVSAWELERDRHLF
jgi:hypothetical protein